MNPNDREEDSSNCFYSYNCILDWVKNVTPSGSDILAMSFRTCEYNKPLSPSKPL